MSHTDHRNDNGLVDGCIPPGQACPWAKGCKHKTPNCPTEADKKSNAFYCALARLHSLIETRGYHNNGS